MNLIPSSVALISFILLCLYEPVHGVHVFDVYRMFQFDRGTSFGSQKAAINALATSATRRGSLARSLVILPFAAVDIDKLDEIIDKRNAAALLILLPSLHGTQQSITDKDIRRWQEIEAKMMNRQFAIPIYFSWEDASLKEIYEDVVRVSESLGIEGESVSVISEMFGSLSAADQYQFVVSGPEPTALKDISVTNIQGWIAGSPGEQDPKTIAIVSHYDSFAVAPGFATGADSTATGVVALLEVARLFGKLYANSRTQGKHNLLFLLTGAGHVNFGGTKHWLGNTDVRLLEKIDFALCLDAIGSGDNLYMHVSKLPKDETGQKLYEGFIKTAQQMNINLEFVHKKINISNPDIDWEHEQFSRRRVVAATLSHKSTHPQLLARSHIYDVRNIEFIAESLAKLVFGFQSKELRVFEGSVAVNNHFVESWLDTITAAPRVAPFIPKKSPIVVGLEKVMQNYVKDVSNQTFILESEYTFYDNIQGSLSSYRVKPVMFDVLFTLCLIAYIATLYVFLKGPSESWKDLKKLFSNTRSKKLIKKKQS